MENSTLKLGIVSPTYNAVDWIKHHLQTVKNQTYKKFEHVVVDDRSTDGTSDILESWAGQITYFKNDVRMGPAYSHWRAIDYLKSRCDIVIHLDGDDWLLHNRVFEVIVNVYNDPKVMVTYGGYIPTDLKFPLVYNGASYPPREAIVKGWTYSHLRTFRSLFLNCLDEIDLQDESNKWLTAAADVAIMCPVIELAGLDHVKRIELPLCQYNRFSDLNEDKIKLNEQMRCATSVANKPVRQRLKYYGDI